MWNGKLYDILIRDTYGPVSTPRIQGMSSVRIVRNDGTVVVWLGEKNVPEWFGWLSVSTGFITDSNDCGFSEVVQSIRL